MPTDKLRVLFVSTSYPRDMQDWRGLFVRHLVDALARLPQIHLAVWAPPGELPADVEDASTPGESAWLRQLMESGGIAHLLRKGGMAALLSPFTLLRCLAAAYKRHAAVDVYHINWLQCALPFRGGKAAVITALGSDMNMLRIPMMRVLLRRAMRGSRVTLCPNATWMEAPLAQAFGRVAAIKTVSFGIDPCWYAIDRHKSADRAQRWLVVARLTTQKLGSLLEWAEPLFRDQPRELHLFGPMQESIVLPEWIHYHGPCSPDDLSREWFPTARGLITLSHHTEGRPQVMLEAMAAGLPIVASRMPAHEELVQHGRTGYLCGSQAEFAAAIQALDDSGTNERFGMEARAWATREVGTWDDCARRYLDVYRGLLSRRA